MGHHKCICRLFVLVYRFFCIAVSVQHMEDILVSGEHVKSVSFVNCFVVGV